MKSTRRTAIKTLAVAAGSLGGLSLGCSKSSSDSASAQDPTLPILAFYALPG